jgi:uncharacterized protein YndB with AHSA1/START domain
MNTPKSPSSGWRDAPAGTVAFDGNHASLAYERRLPYSPERIWAALTRPEELTAWFAHKVEIEPGAGGRVAMVSGPSAFASSGAILTWDPPRVFEYEWHAAPRAELPQGEPESVVRWELTPTDGGTLLRFSQRRLTRGTAIGFAPGMHAFLDQLSAWLDGEALPDWQERYNAVAANYPAWGR